jgi:hypothetical protein
MRHKSVAATMDQTDIRGLVTTVHDQFVTGPMSAQAVNPASMAFKKG